MSEDQLTVECYKWFHNELQKYRDLLWHTPNGGSRNYMEANKFKAMGVRPGIPDFLFLFNGVLYEIEMKTDTGIQTKEQKNIEQLHTLHGAKYYVIRSLDAFKALILNILNNFNHTNN